MHPDPVFHWRDRGGMRAFVKARGFGLLCVNTLDGPRVVHLPIVFLADETIAFHIAKDNEIAVHLDGADALFAVQGPDAYVSPDDYGSGDVDEVPTWNYVAVELSGRLSRAADDRLLPFIDILALEREQQLAHKPVWSRDRLTPGVAERMARGIVAYTMAITAWRGTRKLGQNKSTTARIAAAAALAARGQADIAGWMKDA